MRTTVLLACLLPVAAQAQSSAASRIDEVLVYPGGAQVTRLATVSAGAKELVLTCLTARFDPDSLQIDAPPGVNLGPVQVETLPRERLPECANGPLDEQVRKLEGQRDVLAAESAALETSLGYLKALGSGEARSTPAAGIAGTADSIRKVAQDALLRQAQLRRLLEDLDKQMAPLKVERDRVAAANPQWRALRVRLSTPKEAELKLSYRISQAGWAPNYRALLDTASGALGLERLAQVSQQSGEDWRNVKLRLSTAQATQKVGQGQPRPWQLDVMRPQPQFETRAAKAMPAPPAPAAPMLESVAVSGYRPAAVEQERFDLSVFQGAYATEFVLPLRVNVDSGTQRASLTLGTEKLQARVLARVQPQTEAAAYVVADAPKPTGAWPRGTVQLVRDGALVGSSTLDIATGEERLELPFGRDESVRVLVEPEQRNAGNTGFIGTRAEHRHARASVVENRHASGSLTLQLVEAAPVSQHEDIKVQSQFSPTPTTQAWRKQPGLVLWELPLAAGQSQRFTAEYVISAPKEMQVTGTR
ncbi:MAG: mucoidy inhibitor MuiA family protein [Rubrivivax sp.]|nr:MAG: mucoidy inhibitor MuiA family protein [Rubrivivax sp.]